MEMVMALDTGTGRPRDLYADPTTKGLIVKPVGTGTGGASLVDQGVAGASPWLITGQVQAGGHVAAVMTPTISTSAYAAGNLIGGKLTATSMMNASRLGGILQTLLISDKSNIKLAIDVLVFNADPSATTFTDRAAFALNAADLLKLVGVISVAAGDYVSFSANAIATKAGLGHSLKGTTTSLWFALVARAAGTYVASADLQITADFLQD